ncbi:MAG: TetR/AcrR family transcriptional regulator [Bacteroidales bacterium]|nr:TetR/AcrR family transcriptional regulator [Bacteroidales bacterium]
MVSVTENTEQKIIDAACKVFIQKGMDGARMQEIADEADINKALLHYYFRSKSKLFDRVFVEIFSDIVKLLGEEINHSTEIIELIERMVNNYIHLIRERPFVPDFVLHELNRHPQLIVQQIHQYGMDFSKFQLLIDEGVLNNKIHYIQPVHLIVNVLSMCIFPFVAKPIIMGFMLNGDEAKYNQFIDERAGHVVSFIKSSLLINNPE